MEDLQPWEYKTPPPGWKYISSGQSGRLQEFRHKRTGFVFIGYLDYSVEGKGRWNWYVYKGNAAHSNHWISNQIDFEKAEEEIRMLIAESV